MIFAASLFLMMGFQKDAINVRVNGTLVNPGKVYKNRTMVPTRGVLEKLGVEVRWVPASRSVIATGADTTIVLWIGRASAQVNGKDLPLEAPPFISEGTTYVPLRFIAESMHAKVGYEGATNTATVDLETNQNPTDEKPPIGEVGSLRVTPSNWFVAGKSLNFEISAPRGQDLSLAFSPYVTEDLRLRETTDGLYTGTWNAPSNADYGDGTLKVMLLQDGRPAGKEAEIKLDDTKLVQVSPAPGEAFEGAQLFVKMQDKTGPGFDTRGVSVTLNGKDVTNRAQITERDVKLDLPVGQNDVRISIRDLAGKQLYFDTKSFVVGKEDPFLTYDAPNPVKEGDEIRFRVHAPSGSRFSIYLGEGIRIPWDRIREVSPGRYEATYVVGENDQLDNAPVRAVFERDRNPIPAPPISIVPLRIDRVRGEPIDRGTLVQAFATPGCRLIYVGPDGVPRDFTEQRDYPGSYLLTVPIPRDNISSPVKPYIRLRAPRNETGRRNVSFFWPERDLSIARLEPKNNARLDSVPRVIKAAIDGSSGPGLDPNSIRMWVDDKPVRDVTLNGRTDISFRPDPNMRDGDHTVELDARDRLGRNLHVRWGFSLRGSKPVENVRITLFEFLGRGDIVGGQTTIAQFKVSGIGENGRMSVKSSAPGLVGVPESVPVSTGQFTITSRKVDKLTRVNITLSNGNVSAVLPLTLQPGEVDAPLQITELVTMPNKDRDVPKVARVTLNVPAPSGGATINLRSLTPNFLTTVPKAIVREGNTQVGFAITPAGVDVNSVAQLEATFGNSRKVLRITLVPAKLGGVSGPTTVGKGKKFKVTFVLKSPVGPSGAKLKVTSEVGKVLAVPTNYNVAAGANSATIELMSAPLDTTMTITAELNGSRVSFDVKVKG